MKKISLISVLIFVFLFSFSQSSLHQTSLNSQTAIENNQDNKNYSTDDEFLDAGMNLQENTNESDSAKPKQLSTSVFIRMPSIVDYNFDDGSIYYSPALMGGFGLMYKKFYLELGTMIDRYDHYGFCADLIYQLWTKRLDENWHSTTGIIGEVAFFPAQQTYEDLWIYTAGICHMIFLPMKWGTPSIGFLLGGSYMEEAIHLHGRLMLNLSIPVF